MAKTSPLLQTYNYDRKFCYNGLSRYVFLNGNIQKSISRPWNVPME